MVEDQVIEEEQPRYEVELAGKLSLFTSGKTTSKYVKYKMN